MVVAIAKSCPDGAWDYLANTFLLHLNDVNIVKYRKYSISSKKKTNLFLFIMNSYVQNHHQEAICDGFKLI